MDNLDDVVFDECAMIPVKGDLADQKDSIHAAVNTAWEVVGEYNDNWWDQFVIALNTAGWTYKP